MQCFGTGFLGRFLFVEVRSESWFQSHRLDLVFLCNMRRGVFDFRYLAFLKEHLSKKKQTPTMWIDDASCFLGFLLKSFFYSTQQNPNQNLSVSWWKKLLQRKAVCKHLIHCLCLETHSNLHEDLDAKFWGTDFSPEDSKLTLPSAPSWWGDRTLWKWDREAGQTALSLACSCLSYRLVQISPQLV